MVDQLTELGRAGAGVRAARGPRPGHVPDCESARKIDQPRVQFRMSFDSFSVTAGKFTPLLPAQACSLPMPSAEKLQAGMNRKVLPSPFCASWLMRRWPLTPAPRCRYDRRAANAWPTWLTGMVD